MYVTISLGDLLSLLADSLSISSYGNRTKLLEMGRIDRGVKIGIVSA